MINGPTTDCAPEMRARALHYSIAALSSDVLRGEEDYKAEPNIVSIYKLLMCIRFCIIQYLKSFQSLS